VRRSPRGRWGFIPLTLRVFCGFFFTQQERGPTFTPPKSQQRATSPTDRRKGGRREFQKSHSPHLSRQSSGPLQDSPPPGAPYHLSRRAVSPFFCLSPDDCVTVPQSRRGAPRKLCFPEKSPLSAVWTFGDFLFGGDGPFVDRGSFFDQTLAVHF